MEYIVSTARFCNECIMNLTRRGKEPSWPLKLEDNKSKWGRKEGCCACGKVEALCVFESKNKIINLITNIGAVHQINEAEWKDRPVLNRWAQPARQDSKYAFVIKELLVFVRLFLPKTKPSIYLFRRRLNHQEPESLVCLSFQVGWRLFKTSLQTHLCWMTNFSTPSNVLSTNSFVSIKGCQPHQRL